MRALLQVCATRLSPSTGATARMSATTSAEVVNSQGANTSRALAHTLLHNPRAAPQYISRRASEKAATGRPSVSGTNVWAACDTASPNTAAKM